MFTLKAIYSPAHMLKKGQALGELPGGKEVLRNTMRMAWPSVIETVLISLITSVDTIMVSTMGAAAIAAVGITSQPRMVLLAIIFSLNVGVVAIVARRRGQGDMEGARRCLRQSMMLSAGGSFVLACLGAVFARPLMLFAGAQPDVIDDAALYFQINMVGLFFTSVGLTINAAQRGAGNTKISMTTNIVANLVNLAFNYLLIGGNFGFPALGVAGAGIATVLGNIVACLMALASLRHRDAFLWISLKEKWRFDKETLKGLFHISSSAFVEQVFLRIGFLTYTKTVASLGTIAYATHQICMQIINLSFSFGDGLGIAASSLVGQNLGRERPDISLIYGKMCQRLGFLVSCCLMVVFVFGGRGLVGLFSPEAEIRDMGQQLMYIAAVTTLVQISQVIFSGCLRGAGDTRFIAVVSLISVALVRPSLTWIFCYPLNMGLIGAWISLLLDQTMRFTCSFLRFSSGKWVNIKV